MVHCAIPPASVPEFSVSVELMILTSIDVVSNALILIAPPVPTSCAPFWKKYELLISVSTLLIFTAPP